jgi:hypothetical protein
MKTLVLVLVTMVGGCATSQDPCLDAQEHVAACLGLAPSPSASCNPEDAEQLLGLSCETILAETDKSDAGGWLRKFSCELGSLRHCDEDSCQAPLPQTTSCSDLIEVPGCGGCDYYACRESRQACGDQGYFLGYGYKYCTRLLTVTRPRLSTAGQEMLDRARNCLMRGSEEEIQSGDSCEVASEKSFAMHPQCYVENGACALPLSDMFLILSSIDPGDLRFGEIMGAALACALD